MRTRLRFSLVAVVFLAIVGCHGGGGSDTTVVVQPGTTEPFALTLVNNTSQILTPGPVVANPNTVAFTPLPSINPGSTLVVQIGFLPSSITIGANPAFGNPYPTKTIVLGTDYFQDATGATFIYTGN